MGLPTRINKPRIPSKSGRAFSAPTPKVAAKTTRSTATVKAWQPVGESKTKAPYGFFEGVHHAGGNRSPRDAAYQGDSAHTVFRIPRRADFAVDGLNNLKKAKVEAIFSRDITITGSDGKPRSLNLLKAENDSIPVDDFYAALEGLLKKQRFTLNASEARALGISASKGVNHITGQQVIERIEATLAKAEALSVKAKPEAAPLPNDSPRSREQFKKTLRRFMVQTVLHTMDLTKVHTAMGFSPKKFPMLNETLRHDLVEPVPLKDLAWQLERRVHEPWMENWLRAEIKAQQPRLLKGNETAAELYALALAHPELKFNCSALNPNYTVAMYRWGDSREDANGLMDPHRLSPHHNGNSAEAVDFQRRAVNFLSHHMPREHQGVRHESRGSWDTEKPGDFGKLEHALATDPAIKESTILKAIARDAARFYRAMEDQGYAVPWQKLRVPDAPEFARLDSAYQSLQANNKAADVMIASQRPAVEKAFAEASPPVVNEGRALVKALDALSSTGSEADLSASAQKIVSAYEGLVAKVSGPADTTALAALGKLATARFTQLSARTVESTRAYVGAAERLEPALYAVAPELKTEGGGHLFMAFDKALKNRQALDGLANAAQATEKAGDSSTAQTYRNWRQLLSEGFPSVAN